MTFHGSEWTQLAQELFTAITVPWEHQASARSIALGSQVIRGGYQGIMTGSPGKAVVIHWVCSAPMKYISPTMLNGAT
jgi:hypothetical protein